jgi:hypothetical protein
LTPHPGGLGLDALLVVLVAEVAAAVAAEHRADLVGGVGGGPQRQLLWPAAAELFDRLRKYVSVGRRSATRGSDLRLAQAADGGGVLDRVVGAVSKRGLRPTNIPYGTA